jgi:excisionase family DNA binding protein
MSATPITTAPPTEVEPLIFDAVYAAKILGAPGGRRTIYRWVRERGLPYIALGQRSMGFTRVGLEAWLAEQEKTSR